MSGHLFPGVSPSCSALEASEVKRALLIKED